MDFCVTQHIKRLLVANRSEIAIRVFRAASELGITTIAVYAEEDKLSLHRFKSDEAYLIGRQPGQKPLGPIEAYLSIDEILRVARDSGADAIHPGYGFLSENPDFAEACAAAGIIFIGPRPETMRRLGNKVAARHLAASVNVPVMPASAPLGDDPHENQRIAAQIGYPVMLKASWGGGGRGMRPIEHEDRLLDEIAAARREALAAFGNDEVYLEKLVRRAQHIEVQLLGDAHGNLVHLYERDCSIQRRHQKIVERAPAPFLNPATRLALCDAALRIGHATAYQNAGTVEFLLDDATGEFYFIEVNPRIQVEHTVTEMVTGIDIVKAQIRIASGGTIGDLASTGVPAQSAIHLDGHALQCRITTENPENNFIPDYGRISAYRGAFGFGIRLDGGTAYSGAVVTRFYDALLEKVTAWAPTPEETIARMVRALREYRIRGVTTNLAFLEALLTHPAFQSGDYTTRFIDQTPELLSLPRRQDRATKLLRYIADVSVNGHPETRGKRKPVAHSRVPVAPLLSAPMVEGTRQKLDRLGPSGFAAWMREHKSVLITDTTMRDAHQSLLATRMRSYDILAAAPAYSAGLPALFSLECWGGATFDVAMRFLAEDPWERLSAIRAAVPNILLQMLLRGANGVGYTNYPDNIVQFFVRRAAAAGIDLFRIFDCLNWVDNMRIAIDAVCNEGKLAEGALCYTGDILDPDRAKYALKYYIDLAKQLEAAGCHILAIKDMAGVLKPNAARVLVSALKSEIGLPIHVHTHDTSGIGGATLLAAVAAGADAIDAAMDSLSGLTSQPCLGSLVEAWRHTEADSGLDPESIRQMSFYWEAVRGQYAAFESDLQAGASEVYLHEMPGGQFTNLREQARSLGLETRWHEIARAYRDANMVLGDIVKVTPSSKVVGDLALMMVSQDLSPADLLDPAREVAFPQSVVDMLRGDLGQPPGGWPEALSRKVLKGQTPYVVRPGSLLAPADLTNLRAEAQTRCGGPLDDEALASYAMYPDVYAAFRATGEAYGPVATLPTPVYFYGMRPGDEIAISLEPGKTLNVRLQILGETDDEGNVRAFFELNGQPRVVKVPNRAATPARPLRRKADEQRAHEIGAPMPGTIVAVLVREGQTIAVGEPLIAIEAMKMQTRINAPVAGIIGPVHVRPGDAVEAKDLLVELAL